MAGRQFVQFQYSLERKVVHIFGEAAIGASGAPTLSAAKSKGIASIVRAAAGKYTVTLSDKYRRVLMLEVLFKSTTGIPDAPIVGLISDAVSTGPTLQFQCADADTPAATDPGSGETMKLHIVLTDSSLDTVA